MYVHFMRTLMIISLTVKVKSEQHWHHWCGAEMAIQFAPYQVICQTQPTWGGSFHWLSSAHYFCLLPSQIKGTDDFCQPSDAVWQMSQHLLSPWFIGSEWPPPQGGTHEKGQALVKGGFWTPAPPTTFIPSLSGLYISLLVIVWPSAAFRAALTTLLSKHGVCAKCRHLPFTPLIQLYWVPSVRWSANLLEGWVWPRFRLHVFMY